MPETHRRTGACAAAALVLLAGCGSSSGDGEVKAAFTDGVAAIRGTHGYPQLRVKLVRVVARLRAAPDGEARRLALRGFEATLHGVEARIAFVENDRGNIEAATRDARKADVALRRGAGLLRAAGRMLGQRVGDLNGY
jgi:hypothetical protein